MAERMYVQVREERVRATPSFLGESVVVVRYGDLVSVHKVKESWSQIETHGQRGWLHNSALSQKEIELSPDSSPGKLVASDDELTLAGKGFNKLVEEKYRTRNRHISFVGVDRLETVVVSSEEMQAFMAQGALQPGEEGS